MKHIKALQIFVFLCCLLLPGFLQARELKMIPDGVLAVELSASYSSYRSYLDNFDSISYGEKLLRDRQVKGDPSGNAKFSENNYGVGVRYGLFNQFYLEFSSRFRGRSKESDVSFQDVTDDNDVYDQNLLTQIASSAESFGISSHEIRFAHQLYKTYNFEILYALGYLLANENFDKKEYTNYLRYSSGGNRYSGEVRMNFYNIIYKFLYGFSFRTNSQTIVTVKTKNEKKIDYSFAPEVLLRGFFEVPTQNSDYGFYLEYYGRDTEYFGKQILNRSSSLNTIGGYLKLHNLDSVQPNGFPFEVKIELWKAIYGKAQKNDFGVAINFQTFIGF